jgi:hypothetical protein
MLRALAMAGNVIPKAINSFALAENLQYNTVVCSTGIMMRTAISAAVRIGCRRVRQFLGKPFRREPSGILA